MKVRVLFFASLRERLGCSSTERVLAPGSSAGALVAGLRADFPGLEGAGRFAIAVNSEYADEGRLLVDGDEVALIPPVSGGRGPTPPARRGSLP